MAAGTLTDLQRRFVEQYLVQPSASAAYVAAGYKARGNAAEVNAARLLRNAQVKAAIAAAQDARAARAQVSADDVVRELMRIAFLDPRKVMAWGPAGVTFTPSDRLDEDTARCVAEASQTVTEAGGTIRVKLADKVQALHLLAKHLGMFVDRVELTEKTRLIITEEIVDAPPHAPPE